MKSCELIALPGIRRRSLAKLGDVGSGGEDAVATNQNEDSRKHLELRADRVQLIHHRLVDRVANIRPIQLHDDPIRATRNENRREPLGRAIGCRHDQPTRSIINALPWPTPTHIVASPYRECSRSIRPSRVTTSRDPLEPSG